MRRRLLASTLLAVGLVAMNAWPAAADSLTSAASTGQIGPELVEMSYRGVSPPVTSLPPADLECAPRRWLGEIEGEADREDFAFDEHGVRYGTGGQKMDDTLVSPPRSDGEPEPPDLLVNVAGLSSIIDGPPDPEGAVGPDHYVQAVNIQFQVFDKQGAPLTQPVLTNSLWAGTGDRCESDLYADPLVLYDETADRWLIGYIALAAQRRWVGCIAVSTGGDPTGQFFLYQLDSDRIPDYPKLGAWPDPVNNAYVMGTIPIPDPQGKHDVFALDRERLLLGVEPRPAQRFAGFPNFLMPADLDGPLPPPAGSPGLLYTFRDGGESFFVPPTPVDTLDVYEISIDWDNPGNSRLVPVQSFSPPEFAEFNWTLCGWNNPDCLEQPGTTQKIDSISWLPMQRLQYRNLGVYETLVGVWTVNAVAEGRHAAPRWFELRRSNGGAWRIAHQGTFAPSRLHRWMASVALDGSGNMAMGYSVVYSPDWVYPSLRYAVRPVNSADFVGERTLAAGQGYQSRSNRWGDYASMEVDPADDCTFWFTGEYLETTGTSTWSTRIGAFKLPECTGELAPPPPRRAPARLAP